MEASLAKKSTVVFIMTNARIPVIFNEQMNRWFFLGVEEKIYYT